MSHYFLRSKKRVINDETSMAPSTSGIKKIRTGGIETMALLPIHEVETSMVPSTSKQKANPFNDIILVKKLIDLLADEIYDLAGEKIGGTVIIYHLCKDTADWHATKDTFISPPKAFNQPYQPGFLKKIFTSKGPEENFHDGAVILYLSNGLIDSVSAKLFMVKHDCKDKCANRGTRHTSACCFSNFTPVPIIVISEEKCQVSLFWNGRVQFGIEKEELKKELLKAYVKQEESCLAYTTFDDQYFSKYFHLNPIIPLKSDYTWFVKCYTMNLMDLHKGVTIMLGVDEVEKTITPENPEHRALAAGCVEYNYVKDLSSYDKNEQQCLLLSHGGTLLGGFFYKFIGKSIVFGNFFLLRQLFHDGFVARFLLEVFWKKMHPNCNSMVFDIPEQLEEPFADLVDALNDKENSSLRVKYKIRPGRTISFSGYDEVNFEPSDTL